MIIDMKLLKQQRNAIIEVFNDGGSYKLVDKNQLEALYGILCMLDAISDNVIDYGKCTMFPD